MSKKAKTEVDEKSAVIITDAVLAENQAKLDSYEKSIKAVQERRRKVIIDSKLYTYDKLSQLYNGAEGLVDSCSDGADSKSDNSSDDDAADGQTSFFGDNSYKD